MTTVIKMDIIFIERLTNPVSMERSRSSGISIFFNLSPIELMVEEISMLVSELITPAAPDTTCCATSNTAIVISKVWVTINTAIHALKNHLKNIKVSSSCRLFLSIIMLISS